MCRLTAYLGEPILMADLVTRPRRSVVRQSFDAKERLGGEAANLNGDGFGVGWYTSDCQHQQFSINAEGGDTLTFDVGSPCVFKSVTPAWSNGNLARISQFVRSHIIFAHVRAATVGSPVSEAGCHPFHYGRLMWMHNGEVGGFSKGTLRRKLLSLLSDEMFTLALENGCTDTAVCFSLFLSLLGKERCFKGNLPPSILRQKVEETIQTVCNVVTECGIKEASLLNFVVTDGSSIVASRFVHSLHNPDAQPATLYYTSGTKFQQGDEDTEYHMVRANRQEQMAIIASEPLTDKRTAWVKVPPNCTITISSKLQIVLHPLILNDSVPSTMSLDELALISAHSSPMRPNSAPVHRPNDQVRIGPTSLHKLTEHKDTVMALLVGNGKTEGLLFSGAQDAKVRVWDIKKQEGVAVMHGHMDSVVALEYSDHHGLLFSASSDSTIRGWFTDGYVPAFVAVADGASDVLSLVVHGNKLYCGCRDTTIRKILIPETLFSPGENGMRMNGAAVVGNNSNNNSNNNTTTFNCCNGSTSSSPCCAHASQQQPPPSSSSSSIPSSSLCECSVMVIPAPPMVLHRDKYLPFGYVCCMTMVGDWLCTGGGEAGVWVWEPELGNLHKILTGHSEAVLCLQAEKENIGPTVSWTLFSGSQDGTVRIWDMETLTCRRTIGHVAAVLSIALSPTLLFIGGNNGSILVCDRSVYRFLFKLEEGESPIQTLVCMRDGTLVCGAAEVHQWPAVLLHQMEGQCLADLKRSADIELQHHLETPRSPSSPQTVHLIVSPREHVIRNPEEAMVVMLSQYIAIKSVSDPKHGLRDECWRAAKLLQSQLRKMGAATALHCGKEGMNPLVLGRIGENKKKPTVTVYGHYDVHPATGQKWKTDPWALTGIDGYLYGRGATDDKGPIVATLAAVERLLEEDGIDGMPVNVVFAIEGEEESGSGGFVESINDCKEWFDGTVAILFSNTYWVDDERPCITYGMRGVLDVSVTVSGPKQDLHSGIDGGAVVSPIHDLVALCATLTGPEGTPAVPGFLENVRSISSHDRCSYEAVGFDVEKYGEKVGVVQSQLRNGVDALTRRWHHPSISISEIVCSNATHSFSVVPRHASVKLSIRFVPDQNADALLQHLCRHVQHFMSMRGSPNLVNVKKIHSGDWWLADTEGAVFKAAESSVERVWQTKPLRVREGGTMPIMKFMENALHAPAVQIPLGQASDGAHLPNERIRLLNLVKGKEVIENCLKSLGEVYSSTNAGLDVSAAFKKVVANVPSPAVTPRNLDSVHFHHNHFLGEEESENSNETKRPRII